MGVFLMEKVTIKDLYRNTENYIDKTVEVAAGLEQLEIQKLLDL